MTCKEQILKEIKSFEKEVNKYNKNIKKFKKKFPKADIHIYLTKKLSSGVFIKKYGSKIEFFKTDRIFSQNDQANSLIELEKWSVNSWSSSSLTKVTIKEFTNCYFEIDEEYVKEEIKKYKFKELNALEKLEQDTLKKLSGKQEGEEEKDAKNGGDEK